MDNLDPQEKLSPHTRAPHTRENVWRWLGAVLPFFFSVLPWLLPATLPRANQNPHLENSLRSSPLPELRAAPVAAVQAPSTALDVPPKAAQVQALEGRTLEARVFKSAGAVQPDVLYGKRKLEGG